MSRNERAGGVIDTGNGAESRRDGEQSADQGPAPARRWAAWSGAWLALLALSAWVARLALPFLLVAAAGALLWGWAAVRGRDRAALPSLASLLLALGIAAGVQWRLAEVAGEWPRLQRSLEEGAARTLDAELDGLVERGEVAVGGVEAAVGRNAGVRPSLALFERLEGWRRRTDVSAVALFDPDGGPVAWAGEHRGEIPAEVRRGERSYVFHEGPLFSYLYFVRQLPQGRTAAAAVLLEANLEVGEGAIPFAERFADRYGLTPRFISPERAGGETVWDWATDRPILSVSFAALTQQHWWERVVTRGRRGVAAVWLAGFVLLGTAWYRRRMGPPGVPVAVGTLGLLVMPLGRLVGAEELFSPIQFVLPVPGPWDVALGPLLLLLVGASVWLLTRTPPEDGGRPLPAWAQALLAAAVFPLALGLVARSAASGWLAAHAGGGFALQLATTLLIALPLYLLLRPRRSAAEGGLPRVPLLLGGLLLALAGGAAVVLAWHPQRPLPLWLSAGWGIPVLAVALSLSHLPERRATIRAWAVAGWLAGSAALPFLWTLHVSSELGNAEGELARLGTEPDPFLDFLMRQFAERAMDFAGEREEGVNLLYHSWVDSGLAREGYEARLTLWRGGEVETELRLSPHDSIPALVPVEVARFAGATEPVVQRYTREMGLHYLLLVPLPDGRTLSVAVPPRYRAERATALARFLHPESEGEEAATNEALYLVPVGGDGVPETPSDTLTARSTPVRWLRIENGWRSEARAHFPDGWMHAHLVVRTETIGMLLVRATLALSALLLAMAGLWSVARLLCGELPVLPGVRRQWMRSFRGRLTVALFAFFLIPTAIFGAVAYGAVSREVILSAGSLARRALEQAVVEVGSGATLAEAADDVEADLLLYRRGTLEGAGAREVLDLGIFDTWLPPETFLEFARGEDLEAQASRRLGENEYLIAYRRYDPERVLAAPLPLASHEISRRQRDFAHLALLVSLVGGAFSVVLSLLVGRALTRPLDELSEAVATVGAGNLRVRLPERGPDEFGRVYGAFNRMVRRLHSARAALVRETRRTETIVAEAATGVMALDAARCVELVNPRASEILGVEPEVGKPLPRSGALLGALAEAVEGFWSQGATESTRELQIDGRIVRLRLRRLLEAQERRGAVVALEDVTAEVRTARVLAWGEMARQVAHEIKNPLTPIKLSVQHLRRAHSDGRKDFGEILDRNVEAILQEIDRLGDIARAFARFGTPQQQEAAPERVDLVRAIEETLALYRGGGSGIRYALEVDGERPLHATARLGELKEVLVNLLENAREALHGSGEIRVSAARSEDGEWVELVVADTGEGIPAEMLPRIFEPHFSTRTSGTGLGLAIVRRMVESWGGEIAAESEPGVGTRIRILLRASEEEGRPAGLSAG